MENVAAEEDGVTLIEHGRPLPPGVPHGDRGEPVLRLVGIVGAAHRLDVGQVHVAAVALRLVGVRVDRLVLAPAGDPDAAVLLVGAVERDPRPDERVRLRDDVEGVLVVALSRTARALDEGHRLQRKYIRPDQAGHDVDDPRVEQVPLVDLELAVEHVDAEDIRALRDQLVDVLEQLLELVWLEQAAHDEMALLAEANVLLYGDRCLVHSAYRTLRAPQPEWPQCAGCCLKLIYWRWSAAGAHQRGRGRIPTRRAARAALAA